MGWPTSGSGGAVEIAAPLTDTLFVASRLSSLHKVS